MQLQLTDVLHCASKCVLISYKFNVLGTLNDNISILCHKGAKAGMSLRCKECGKCFSRERNLRRHERVHTGKKPDECKQCGNCFSPTESLRIHD